MQADTWTQVCTIPQNNFLHKISAQIVYEELSQFLNQLSEHVHDFWTSQSEYCMYVTWSLVGSNKNGSTYEFQKNKMITGLTNQEASFLSNILQSNQSGRRTWSIWIHIWMCSFSLFSGFCHFFKLSMYPSCVWNTK